MTRLPALLALKVARWKASVAEGHSSTDRGDSSQQPDLGTSPGDRRTLTQAGNPGIAANGEEFLASRSAFRTEKRLDATLEDLCAKPCKYSCRLRLCHCGDGALPRIVCAGAHGDRFAENPALQRDSTSPSFVDRATISRSHRKRLARGISSGGAQRITK